MIQPSDDSTNIATVVAAIRLAELLDQWERRFKTRALPPHLADALERYRTARDSSYPRQESPRGQ